MQQHTLDSGVFIRSMATRGSLGGLARATRDALKLLGAAGYEWLLVETVGIAVVERPPIEGTGSFATLS